MWNLTHNNLLFKNEYINAISWYQMLTTLSKNCENAKKQDLYLTDCIIELFSLFLDIYGRENDYKMVYSILT